MSECPHPLGPEGAAELPVRGSPSPAGAAALFGTKQPQNPWIFPGDSRGNLLTHLTRTNTPHRCSRELGGPRDPGNPRTGSSRPRHPPTPRPPARFGRTEPRSVRGAESRGGGRAGKTWGQPGPNTDNPGGPWRQLEGAMRTGRRGHGYSLGVRWGHGDSPGGGRGGTNSLGGTRGDRIRPRPAAGTQPPLSPLAAPGPGPPLPDAAARPL